MTAIALNCRLSKRCVLVRKNYFYVDMAKNFQISMYEKGGGAPIGMDGYITINVDGQKKRVGIYRIQLEEDPAKLVHIGPIDLSPYTLVDYNRSGIALLEIVTKPELHSPREARLFLQKLRSILEHLGVFDGSLEGSMRCDANISIQGGGRVEIKNISSFKEVERALNFEISRQTELIKKGLSVERETRHWDEARRITITLRVKEEEHDYRYFPEPDLLPVDLTEDFIESIKAKMPELPDARAERFVKQYGLPEYDAAVLTSDKALADFFEACAKDYPDAKKVSNWIMGDLLGVLHELDLDINESKITSNLLVEMLKLIDQGVISGKIGKFLLPRMVKEGKRPSEIVSEYGLTRLADKESLEELVDRVFKENPKAVKDALADEKAVHYLIGQVMKATRGRADPQITNELVRKKLAELKLSAQTEV
mgnify:CR=1 FL=1